MACGLVRASTGGLFVSGHGAVAVPQRARMLIGVAPQDVHLDRFLTARKILVSHGRYFGMDRLDSIDGVGYPRFILPGLLVMTVGARLSPTTRRASSRPRARAISRTC
jgi:hypothetical protein